MICRHAEFEPGTAGLGGPARAGVKHIQNIEATIYEAEASTDIQENQARPIDRGHRYQTPKLFALRTQTSAGALVLMGVCPRRKHLIYINPPWRGGAHIAVVSVPEVNCGL